MKIVIAIALTLAMMPAAAARAAGIDFEDLTLDPESNWHGPDPNGFDQSAGSNTTERVGSFTSGGATFNNVYNHDFDSWGGWAYSNTTDVVSGEFTNQYSAYHLPNGGGDASATYAVAFFDAWGFTPDPRIELPAGQGPDSMRVTNTSYAALVMRDGNQYSDPFTTGDYFLLKIAGFTGGGQQLPQVIEFPLADYRGNDPYIIDQWTTVDLSPLAAARSLVFTIETTNPGAPAYFAADNLILAPVPEPSAALAALAAAAMLLGSRRAGRTT